MNKSDENIVELNIGLATLTEHVQNQSEKVKNQSRELEQLKNQIGVLITSIEVITARLFTDNGKLSIISQFQKNDEEMFSRVHCLEKKVDEIVFTNDNNKSGKKNTKEWIKWMITTSIALFAFLLSIGVIKK